MTNKELTKIFKDSQFKVELAKVLKQMTLSMDMLNERMARLEKRRSFYDVLRDVFSR